MVNEHEKRQQEHRLEEILKSNLLTTSKIAAITKLGFSEMIARGIVAQVEAHSSMPAYYERIGPVSRSR